MQRLTFHEMFVLLADREGSNIQPIWTRADTAEYLGISSQNPEEIKRRISGMWDRFKLMVKEQQQLHKETA